MDVPGRLREVTPEWVTELLRGAGALNEARVTGVGPELIGHFSNQVWRLVLTYDRTEPGAPAALVLKRPQPSRIDEPGQDMEQEIRFYRELSPRLGLHTPRFFFGHCDIPGRVVLLILEDVGAFEPFDWMEGATDEHTELAIEGLAQLHARFWQGVKDLDWIPSFADPEYRAAVGREYDENWSEHRDLILAEAPEYAALGDALVGRMAQGLVPLGAPQTLLHGDAHFENLALVRRGNERVAIFHDWAAVRLGAPWFDVAVYLVMSFPAERRRTLERSVVARHAEALRRAGIETDADPWLGYRRGILAWAARLAAFAPHMPGSFVIARVATAALDHQIDELCG